MRSRNATSSVWERFSGFWLMYVLLSILKIFHRSSHTSRTAWANPQIPDRSQEPAGTNPQRSDRSQGTSKDQADTHIFASTALRIFPSGGRSQGSREYSYGSTQLDGHLWRQFDGEGGYLVIAFRGSLIFICCHLWATTDRNLTTRTFESPLSCAPFRPSDRWFCGFGRPPNEPMVSEKLTSSPRVLTVFRFSQQMEQYFANIGETMEGYGEFEAEALAFKVCIFQSVRRTRFTCSPTITL